MTGAGSVLVSFFFLSREGNTRRRREEEEEEAWVIYHLPGKPEIPFGKSSGSGHSLF